MKFLLSICLIILCSGIEGRASPNDDVRQCMNPILGEKKGRWPFGPAKDAAECCALYQSVNKASLQKCCNDFTPTGEQSDIDNCVDTAEGLLEDGTQQILSMDVNLENIGWLTTLNSLTAIQNWLTKQRIQTVQDLDNWASNFRAKIFTNLQGLKDLFISSPITGDSSSTSTSVSTSGQTSGTSGS